MTAVFYVGDAIEVMSKLPEKSVDLILTSPPFLALRSYLPADHPDKAKEGGSQSTPGEFIDWLLDVVEACDRVLAPHGSLCIELGDTYSGSGGAGGDYDRSEQDRWVGSAAWAKSDDGAQRHRKKPMREGQPKFTGSGKLARYSDARGNPDGMRDTTFSGGNTRTGGGTGWPLAKSLSLIPESFRWAMVYGRNPFTGRTTEPWRLRNVIRWVRPNPPVGALGDKFRPATSELMVFCKSAKRYFDLDAVREPYADPTRYTAREERGNDGSSSDLDYRHRRSGSFADGGLGSTADTETEPATGRGGASGGKRQGAKAALNPDSNRDSMGPYFQSVTGGAPPLDWWNIPLLEGEEETRYGPKPEKPWVRKVRASGDKGDPNGGRDTLGPYAGNENPLGSPPLDWWNIPPGGYEGAHYAVFPPELCIKPVKAMCPEKVCRVCGEPSRRITDVSYEAHSPETIEQQHKMARGVAASGTTVLGVDSSFKYGRATKNVETLGFSDCGHDDWRPGLVLDPFAGSGTTLAVATGHGRDAIGIDLDERNYELALQRVGPFILERAG